MLIYSIAVAIIAVVSSFMLIYFFNKSSLYDIRVIVGITISSTITGIIFPYIFTFISSMGNFVDDNLRNALTLLVVFTFYIITMFLSIVIISSIISQNREKSIEAILRNLSLKKLLKRIKFSSKTNHINDMHKLDIGGYTEEAAVVLDIHDSTIESSGTGESQVYQDGVSIVGNDEIDRQKSSNFFDFVEDKIKLDNMSEKPVDTYGNIDKMGLGNIEHTDPNIILTANADQIDTSIEVFIDQAFKYKMSGDYEGAINQYMLALDVNPDNELVFWIILDICTLYKSLGQVELAQQVLESYYTNFADIMNTDIKMEIERNLSFV